jgi:hypothetical protein
MHDRLRQRDGGILATRDHQDLGSSYLLCRPFSRQMGISVGTVDRNFLPWYLPLAIQISKKNRFGRPEIVAVSEYHSE